MTREEAIKHATYSHYCNSESVCFNLMRNSFKQGAEWADTHPVNLWHKTSEELPEVDKYRKCIKVFARRGDDVFVALYSSIAGFSLSSSFYTEYILSDIEYWMPIPELPKE